MVIRSALITIFTCMFFLNGYSQTTYNDTIIALDQVEIQRKVRKPKVKKIVYGKNFDHYYFNRTYEWYANKRYFLIENFPFGEIMQLEFFAFNKEKYIRLENGEKPKNTLFCNPEKHTVNIYEALEENGNLSLGKLLYSKDYILPPENTKAEYKVMMDLSEIKYRTDKFFIQLVSPLDEPKDCRLATLGLNILKDPKGIYYMFDEQGNFVEEKGFTIEMTLKVLTTEY
jgi:hypothetical protein